MSAADDILAAIAQVNARITAVEAKLDKALTARAPSSGAPAHSGAVADDGLDEEVKFDPKSWEGRPVAPCKMSEGTPEWLECVAGFAEWQAKRDDQSGAVTDKGQPKSFFGWRRAARARGWAARIRAKPATPAVRAPADSNDDIPF